MIKSFKDGVTESIWLRHFVKNFPAALLAMARRRLGFLADAVDQADLRIPPGNKLEVLEGNRAGQFSIRMNDQWRVCFPWIDGNAFDVEITDYH